jgi:hypothetical protein
LLRDSPELDSDSIVEGFSVSFRKPCACLRASVNTIFWNSFAFSASIIGVNASTIISSSLFSSSSSILPDFSSSFMLSNSTFFIIPPIVCS